MHRLGSHRDTEGISPRELRHTGFVEDVDLLDGEACGHQQIDYRAREMAASAHPLLHWLEKSLETLHPLIRRQSMLEEMKAGPRLQNTSYLAQGGQRVGDGAQSPRREGGVETLGLEREYLSIQAGTLPRDRRGSQSLTRQPPAQVSRLDRRH